MPEKRTLKIKGMNCLLNLVKRFYLSFLKRTWDFPFISGIRRS